MNELLITEPVQLDIRKHYFYIFSFDIYALLFWLYYYNISWGCHLKLLYAKKVSFKF